MGLNPLQLSKLMTHQWSQKIAIAFCLILIGYLSACSGNKHSTHNRIATPPIKHTQIVKSIMDQRHYLSITLPNQLQVMLISDPSIKKSAAALSVAVGSYQEPKDFGGLAHYLEHMLFLGTKAYPKVGDYDNFLSRNGGFNNAYTELDHTNYIMSVNNEAYTEALHRFSGFFYEPLLNAKYANKERNAVHSEWMMKNPNDGVILNQLNGLTLNKKHPVSQFNWGNLETLTDHGERRLQTELVHFYKTYYSANIMKAVLISHLPLTELKQLATTYFSSIPNKHIAQPQITPLVATPKELKKIIHYLPQTDMKRLSIEFVIANNSQQFALKPNQYVRYLLDNEMQGTLSPTLRKMGLIEHLSSNVQPTLYGNAGSFSIDVKLTEQGLQHKDKIIGLIFNYIDLIKNKGIDQKYFTEIKQRLSHQFRFKEKIADYAYAWDLAKELQFKPTRYVLSNHYEYQQFDPHVIRDVLTQLTIDNARIFYIDKNQAVDQKMHFFKGQYRIEDITEKKIASWKQAATNIKLNLPATNRLMPKKFALETRQYTDKPKTLINNAGLNLYLGHSRYFKQPKGSFIAHFNSRINDDSPKNAVIADLLEKGIHLALISLKNEASEAGMGINYSKDKGFILSVSGFTEQQPHLLLRAYDIIKNYRLSNAELANLKADYISKKASAKKKILLRQLFPQFSLLMNLNAFEESSLLAELEDITAQEMTTFRDQLLQQTHLNIFAFGNYSEKQTIKMARSLKGLLPKNSVYKPLYQEKLFHPKVGHIVNWKQEVHLTDMAFIDVLFKPLSIKEYANSKILNQILRPALYRQIRTEEQLGYSVGFINQPFFDQLMMGFYIQSSVKGPAAVAKRIELFKQGFITKLAQMTTSEFEIVKKSILVSLTQKPKNLRQEYSSFYQDWSQQKISFDTKNQLIAAVKKARLQDIHSLYESIVTGKDYGRVILQMRGSLFKNKAFIEFVKAEKVIDLDRFHKKYLLKRHTPKKNHRPH
jgi:protease-3